MKHFWLLLFIYPLVLTAADDVYFSKLGIEEGLSQLSVMSIYQDELGAMWFGTREGVSRYNGNSMEVIRPVANDSNSLHGNLIRNLCGDKSGSVYIHSQGGINRYDLRTGKVSNIQRENADAMTYGTSVLWIAERNKIYEYNKGDKTLYAELPEPNAQIRVLRETSQKVLVAGTLASHRIFPTNRK